MGTKMRGFVRVTNATSEEITKNKLKEINAFRRQMGMHDIKAIKKRCLRCDKSFTSFSRGQHMCGCIREDGAPVA